MSMSFRSPAFFAGLRNLLRKLALNPLLSCRFATPRCMKMQARVVYDRLRLCRAKAGNLWCGKPAKQSGPDIAPNPTLSPPSADGEHAEQIVFAFDVLRRGKKGDDHGEHLSLLRRFGCAQGVGRSLCATHGAERPARPADTPLG